MRRMDAVWRRWRLITSTALTERWLSLRRTRRAPRARPQRLVARLTSSVAIVSVVWFTSTSWRRDQVSAPYRLFHTTRLSGDCPSLNERKNPRNCLERS